MAWETIRPFLSPIAHLIDDPDISDILVNGQGGVFIEKFGHMTAVPGVTIEERSLQAAIRNIARALGDEIDEEKPILDARLPDGSRVAAVFPPCAVAGTILAIRKFHSKIYTAEELVRIGTLPAEVLGVLRGAVERRENILISGSTGSGKTTLLTALARFIDPDERVLVIEDTSEIQMEHKHLVRLEARREQPGLPAVTIRDLLKASLRLRPDRILLGEVRGGEAFDLMQALNTGHGGTISTIHANSAEESISRFTTCVLQSDIQLPYRVIRSNIGEALRVLVHVARRPGRRSVTEVKRIREYDLSRDHYALDALYDHP